MRTIILLVAAILLPALKVQAIVDANGNGLSDLWERQYNNDELFPDGFDPEADPDSDGWTHSREAAAGTDPFSTAHPDGYLQPDTTHIPAIWGDIDNDNIPDLITPEVVQLTWPTTSGKQYTLWASPDLATSSWLVIDEPFIGTGTEVTYNFLTPAATKTFWRVSIGDVDSDLDSLTDAEEYQIGTNPNLPDSDDDGLEDGEEVANGANPINSDTDQDGRPDGDDAHPTEPLVNWEPALESSYILIDVVVPPGAGIARDLNDKGEVLFSNGIWSGGTFKGLPKPQFDGPTAIPNGTYHSNQESWEYFNNSGKVLGVGSTSYPEPYQNDPDQFTLFLGGTADSLDFTLGMPMWSHANLSLEPVGIDDAGGLIAEFRDATYTYPGEPPQEAEIEQNRIVAFAPGATSFTHLPLPDGYEAAFVNGFLSTRVTPGGWVATLAAPTSQSSGSANKAVLWNPQRQLLSLPPQAEDNHQRLHLSELPGNNIGLIASINSDLNSKIFLGPTAPDSTISFVPGLSSKKIHAFAGDGTAMTLDNKLWRNGKFVAIRENCPGYAEHLDAGWSLFPQKGNKDGSYLFSCHDSEGQSKAALLLSVQSVSRDKMFAGSFVVPEGWDDMEIEFGGIEDLGRYGNLLSSGTTRVYDSVSQILSEGENSGMTHPDNQQAWFVKDPENPRKIYFYTCYNAIGEANLIFHLPRVSPPEGFTLKHMLSKDAEFATVISYVDRWMKGTSFAGQNAYTTWLSTGSTALQGAVGTTTIGALIPFFDIIDKVAGLKPLVMGLCDGVRMGLNDDKEFLLLVGGALATSANWVLQNATDSVGLWDDAAYRGLQLMLLLRNICNDAVLPYAAQYKEKLGTWDGFRNETWKALKKFPSTSPNWFLFGNPLQLKICEGILAWGDNFCTRMMTGAEKVAWDSTPWENSLMLSEVARYRDRSYYTFGYTFGYLSEQVVSGALTAGIWTVGKMAAKNGISMLGHLTPRAISVVAVRMHYLKEGLRDFSLIDDGLRPAYEGVMSSMARQPTSPNIKEIPASHMESRMAQGFDRATFNFNEWVKTATKNGNVRKLIATPGGRDIFAKRTSQLMQLLGDQCDATTMKNFMKVAEERVVIVHPDGAVDEYFEGFFRAFEGNSSLLANLDDPLYSIVGLSDGAKARLKFFLSDPDAGALWKLDDYAPGDPESWKRYIARGVVAELDVYKRIYKNHGLSHAPTAPGYDFSGDVWVQVKTCKNPNSSQTIADMKVAINDLVAESPNTAPLKLHILKNPAVDSAGLDAALNAYKELDPGVRNRVEIFIQAYDIGPQ